MKNRKLIFDFVIVSIVPNDIKDIPEEYNVCSSYEMADILSTYKNPLDDETYQKIRAALQKVAGLKSNIQNDNISEDDTVSLGGKMAHINRAIKNMDEFQHRAANEFTKSPLRIRGIAGSGKTIVLAGRAAYLHSQYPDWNIAITFYSRALKQQLKTLINTFYRTYNPYREPNWEKINILHSWGESASHYGHQEGLYSRAVKSLGATFRNFTTAEAISRPNETPFDAACKELLTEEFTGKYKPEYDVVLIDEAQDMPASFFKLVYNFTKINDEGNKCIIWAYDELQSLTNINMPDESDLFGKDESGRSLISLVNEEEKPRQKISLFVCYRNPMWILVVAHALGFGIYRRSVEGISGLVQMFDDLNTWENVGYECIEGELDFEQNVVLRREANATPEYFGQLLTPEESVQYKKFDTTDAQYDWVAEDTKKNIQEGKLKHEEILIVFLCQRTAWNERAVFGRVLRKKGINSGYIGREIDKDSFREPGKVTMTHIYRAKGNEAPMVYVLDADYCAGGTAERRNMLFTAITRAKAWVRICGVGENMNIIAEEINACKENEYKLAFKIPSKADLEKIKRISQEAQDDIEQETLDRLMDKLRKLLSKKKISEEDKELLIALIDAENVDAIKAFIRSSSLSRRRKRRG